MEPEDDRKRAQPERDLPLLERENSRRIRAPRDLGMDCTAERKRLPLTEEDRARIREAWYQRQEGAGEPGR